MAVTTKGGVNAFGLTNEETWDGVSVDAAVIALLKAWALSEPPGTFDFYIAPDGDDGEDGLTPETAWAITALETKGATYAESTVGLLDGVYILSGGNSEFIMQIPANASGTSGSRTVVRGVTPRGAVITTNQGDDTYPQFGGGGATDTIQINADFLTFKDIAIVDTAGHGLSISDGDELLIEGCEFSDLRAYRNETLVDNNMGGIFFRGQGEPKENVVIRNCLFEDIYSQVATVQNNTSNGAGDLFGAVNCLVENCTFRRIGTASYLKGRVLNLTFRQNFIIECPGFVQGFSTMNTGLGPSENLVYGNCFVGNWCFGAKSSNAQGDAATIARFYNNTVIMDEVEGSNSCDFGYMVIQGGVSAGSLYFYNNAIYLNPGFGLGPGMIRFPDDAEDLHTRIVVWDYNKYQRFNVEDNINAASYNDLGDWQDEGYDLNSPTVGDLDLVNQGGPAPDDYGPDDGSDLISGGKVGGLSGGATVNIGHTGSGSSWGCTFG